MIPTATSLRFAISAIISISANSRLAISTWISSTLNSQEGRKHRRITARAHGPRLVVAKAQMRGQPARPATGSTVRLKISTNRRGIFPLRVAAHRRLVNRDLWAPRLHQLLPVPPAPAATSASVTAQRSGYPHRLQPPAQGVRTGHTRLEHADPAGARRLSRWNSSTTPSPRGARSSPVTLCLPRWSCAGGPNRRGGCLLAIDALDVAVERQVEIEPRLLAIGDHVQSGGHLVVDGRDRQRRPATLLSRLGRNGPGVADANSSQPGNG